MCNEGITEGRDGRKFDNKNSQVIIDWIVNINKKDIQWDIQHASEVGSATDTAPAQGWTKAQNDYFRVVDGVLEAKVDWNYNGKWLLEDKQLRYYSPVFIVNPEIDKQTNALEIIGITSVGLTNEPNLYVSALNKQQFNQPNPTNPVEENPMDLAQLRAALGLSSSATLDNCVTAVNQMKTDHQKALNTASGNPDMKSFATRKEINAMEQRALAAEQALQDKADEAHATSVEAALNSALTAGKIIPSDRDYYAKQCNTAEGLADFENLMKDKAPVVDPASADFDDTELNKKSKSLNAEEKAVADSLGIDYGDFAKQKKEMS